MELNIQTHTMLLNQTVTLKTERRNVEVKGATWVSSNPAVATVDENGVVTSVNFGETTITATIGNESVTCLVRVPEVSTDGVVFADKEIKLSIGSEKTLEAMVTPSIASNKELTWASADPTIATIDANGKVTAVAEGETTVTATTVDGGQTATCKIIVGKAVESFALSHTEITVVAGTTEKIQPIITPADAVIQDLVWTTTDKWVAVYSGMAVVGVGEGTATLTATTVDGGFTASVTVTVLPYIDVETVAFEKEIVNLAVGGTKSLVATVAPENATNKAVKYLSSDVSVATVDANGLVTVLKEGAATVTAYSVANDEVTDSVEINGIGNRSAFQNKYYSPEGNFTVKAYGVNEVLFNGTALAATEYTYADDVLTVAKSVLAGKTTAVDNTLTLVSAECGDVAVGVKVQLATGTNLGVGEIGAEILGELENLKIKGTNADGSVVLEVTSSGVAILPFDVEYMKAMFAYPNMEALTLRVSAGSISGSRDYSTAQIKVDGTNGWKYGSLSADTTSISNVSISRTKFNALMAEGDETALRRNIYFHFSGLNKGDEIVVRGAYGWYSGTGYMQGGNRIFADMPEDKSLKLELSATNSEVTSFQLTNYNVALTNGFTMDGNVMTIAPEGTSLKLTNGNGLTVNVYGRDGQTSNSRVWVNTATSRDCFWLNTVETPAIEQTFEAGAGYTYAIANNQDTIVGKYTIKSATLDGKDIMAGEVAGVSVTDAGIVFSTEYTEFGTHNLKVRVEKTSNTEDQLWTSFDIHDRFITVVEEIEEAPTDPYGVNFYNGANTALVGSNADGNSYFSGTVVTLNGNNCYKWTKNTSATKPSFYFSNSEGNWLDSVRADDTIESISFDVKAGDEGKTPTVVYFCQWKTPRYYAIAEAGENGWVTFTIPKTYLKDMGNSSEYWMYVVYDEDAENVTKDNMQDYPTCLYFDNFRVTYKA